MIAGRNAKRAIVAAMLTGSLLAACSDDDNKTGVGGAGGAAGVDGGTAGTGGAGGMAEVDGGTAGTGGTGGVGGGMGGTGGTPMACTAANAMNITADVAADTTWSAPCYQLKKQVFIANNATLTIAAGTTILGDPSLPVGNKAALIAARGSKLVAVGTRDKPIVFTSGNPRGTRTSKDWGGVALLGAAKVNSGTMVAGGFLERNIEGIPQTEPKGKYGGIDDASNCGRLEYVRIEFAGAELSPNQELNGLTMGACGSGTQVRYIQVHRGSDDGVEMFGGTASMDHILITGDEDDGLDWDEGWTGKVQFLVVHKFVGAGDNGFEADNFGTKEDATPISNPTLFNVTMVGTPTTRAMLLREGTYGTMRNFVVVDFKGGLIDVEGLMVDPKAIWPGSLSVENGVFFNNADFLDTAAENMKDMNFNEKTAFEDPARKNTFTANPMLGSTSATAPNYVPGNAAAVMGKGTPTFGDTAATYAGAFAPGTAAAMAWTSGWTAYPEN